MATMKNSKELVFDVETHGDPSHPAVISVVGTGASMTAMNLPIKDLVEAGLFVINYNPRDVPGSKACVACEEKVPKDIDLMAELGKIFKEDGSMDTSVDVLIPYTWYDMAQDALQVLDQLNIKKAAVLGISTGGAIAQIVVTEAERICPGRITAGVFCGTALSLQPHEGQFQKPTIVDAMAQAAKALGATTNEERMEYLLPMQRIIFEIEEGSAREKVLKDAMTRDYENGWIDSFGGMNPWSVLAWVGVARMEDEHRKELSQIKTPCLVVHGKNDQIQPLAGGEELAKQIPGSEFYAHENGHCFGPEKDAKALATKIAAFIRIHQ